MVRPIRGEHEAEESGMGQGKIDVTHARRDQLRHPVCPRVLLPGLLRRNKAPVALGGERKWCAGAAWLTPARLATPRSEKPSIPWASSSASAASSKAARRFPW